VTLLIPKILHQIWLGPNPLPEEFVEYRETWRTHHPGWTLELWTEDRLPEHLRQADVTDRLRVPAERADILRLEVLWRYGGVYVDTDFECRRTLESLIEDVDFFTAYLKPGRVNNAIIGSTAGHPILDRALSELKPNPVYGYDKGAAGPLYLDRLVKEYPDIHIFEPELFYPATPGERSQAVAIHHAARSWKDADGFKLAVRRAELRRRRTVSELEAIHAETARLELRVARMSALLERARAGERVGLTLTAHRTTVAAGSLMRKSKRVVGTQAARVPHSAQRRARTMQRVVGQLASRVGFASHAFGRPERSPELRIPRVIHHVWLGPEKPSPRIERARRSWRRNRGWQQRVWTESNLPEALIRTETGQLLRAPEERLQFLRLELLHRFGGIAPDPDLMSRLPIEPAIGDAQFLVASFANGEPDASLLAAVPAHPLIARLLAELEAAEEWGTPPASLGPLIARATQDSDPGALVLPPSAVTARSDETQHTVAIHLNRRPHAGDDPKLDALEAEAALSEAQSRVEEARHRLGEANDRLKAVQLDLKAIRRARAARRAPET
jgi:mannosyltransferase OCH1-like enzyme